MENGTQVQTTAQANKEAAKFLAFSGIFVTKKIYNENTDSLDVYIGILPQAGPAQPYSPKLRFPKVVLEGWKAKGLWDEKCFRVNEEGPGGVILFAPGYWFPYSEAAEAEAKAFQEAHDKYLTLYSNTQPKATEDPMAVLEAKTEKFLASLGKEIHSAKMRRVDAIIKRAEKLGVDKTSEKVSQLLSLITSF